jgi:hypothetical protein
MLCDAQCVTVGEWSTMMDETERLTRFAILCGQCNCGCPELFVDHQARPERRIVITDDFGQRVQMSADQFSVLIEEARSGRLDETVAELTAR